jgi:hypothetical protein
MVLPFDIAGAICGVDNIKLLKQQWDNIHKDNDDHCDEDDDADPLHRCISGLVILNALSLTDKFGAAVIRELSVRHCRLPSRIIFKGIYRLIDR